MDARSSAALWAITGYFNPARYRRRRTNYQIFRQNLHLPLVAVELAFDGDFDLQPGDADVMLQIRGGDVMWQKERLLNLALAALPATCRRVVWVDCDIVFERTDWPLAAERALDRFPLVQPFSRVAHLTAAASISSGLRDDDVAGWQNALAFDVASGRPIRDALRLTPAALAAMALPLASRERYWQRRATFAHAGFAWAAHRDLLTQLLLYDACVVGGGDICHASAAYGCFEELAAVRDMTDPERQRFFAWAEPFHRAVGGTVGFVDGAVYHLWHGDLRDRQYAERHRRLRAFDFNPFQDIAHTADGAWRWNSAKPALHQFVRDYFSSRKEDG